MPLMDNDDIIAIGETEFRPRLLSHGAVDLFISWLNEAPKSATEREKTAYALGRLADWLFRQETS